MYETAERARRVLLRVGEIQRKSEDQLFSGLSFLCTALMVVLVGMISFISGGGSGNVPGLSGAMLLLYENAGGYVLVAVISFAAAVAITVLCLRRK